MAEGGPPGVAEGHLVPSEVTVAVRPALGGHVRDGHKGRAQASAGHAVGASPERPSPFPARRAARRRATGDDGRTPRRPRVCHGRGRVPDGGDVFRPLRAWGGKGRTRTLEWGKTFYLYSLGEVVTLA